MKNSFGRCKMPVIHLKNRDLAILTFRNNTSPRAGCIINEREPLLLSIIISCQSTLQGEVTQLLTYSLLTSAFFKSSYRIFYIIYYIIL